MLKGPILQTLPLKAKLFRGFGDPSRLAILEALRAGPMTVGELVRATALTQPNTSNHLACLRECGLVRTRRRGRFIEYRLSDARVDQILDLAGALLAETAEGLEACPRYADPERETAAREGVS